MKGLDDFITGKYDPSAPFNQTDWMDSFSPIVDECEWIDEVMLNDEPTYNKLGDVLVDVVAVFFNKKGEDKYYTAKERARIIMNEAKEIAKLFEAKWLEINTKQK